MVDMLQALNKIKNKPKFESKQSKTFLYDSKRKAETLKLYKQIIDIVQQSDEPVFTRDLALALNKKLIRMRQIVADMQKLNLIDRTTILHKTRYYKVITLKNSKELTEFLEKQV